MAYQTLNNTEQFVTIRTKINSNFALAESTSNKATAIGSTPSDSKYPSEKAVADYASKIYQSSSIPTTRSGDLLLQTTGSNVGKIMYNAGGSLGEFVPNRSVCKYGSAASLASTILLSGELAIEDNGKQKVGNGSSAYSSLPYLTASISEPGNIGISYGGSAATAYDIQYQQGWIKMPNGMIMQWGLSVYNSNGYSNFDREIILPVAFSKKRIYSHGVLESGGLWNDKQILVHPRGIGTSSLRFVVDSGLATDAPYELHWMAIGF